jgi:hypothetical protein
VNENADELASEFGYDARLIGTVAQLVEQGPFKALVLGSSPSRPTNKIKHLFRHECRIDGTHGNGTESADNVV